LRREIHGTLGPLPRLGPVTASQGIAGMNNSFMGLDESLIHKPPLTKAFQIPGSGGLATI
jgi:hypothetical protein